MKNADNHHEIPKPKPIADFDLASITGGRFKEEDIPSISILHDFFLENYPHKTVAINQIFSVIENSTEEFSYSDVVNMVAPVILG